MKRPYSKPRIAVAELTLDQPIALNCTADKSVIMDLQALGYFQPDGGCDNYLLETGGVDFDKDGKADNHTTVCYHSLVQTAFLS